MIAAPKRIGSIFISLCSLVAVLFLGEAVFTRFTATPAVAEEATAVLETPVRLKPEKQTAKGVYLTASSAGSAAKLKEIIRLIKATELNAVVIDIKDYSGYVLYDSQVPQVGEFKTKRRVIRDLKKMIDTLHAEGVYVIARQTVFQDPILAEKKPEWAIQSRHGGVWRDHKGLAWVDATRQEVWDYNIAIAKEAIAAGFDEINFDYVRFPSDGNLKSMVPPTTGPKYEAMRKFFVYLSEALANEPAWLSVDMFGFVMEKNGTDDLSIGQRLEDVVNVVDFVSPMMYPSHYPSGHLGLKNPAAAPRAVIEHGMEKGYPRFLGARSEVRPWLQAFHLGATYDASKIRAQIDAVEEFTSAGWLLWNASNRYTTAGLKSE